MKKRDISVLLIIGLFVLTLGGCATSMTKPTDMFLAPDFSENQLDKITNMFFPLPVKIDVAGSAFLYDFGINTPSYSWKAPEWRRKENGKWEVVAEWVAVRLEIQNEEPSLIVSYPNGKKEHLGNLTAIVDHGGKRLYNQKGQYIYVPDGWRKVNPEDYPEFFTVIGSDNSMEVAKGTDDYAGLMDFYKQFRTVEAMQIRDSVYKKYGIPLGTALTEEQLKRIEKDPAVDKLRDFFFDKWYVLFTYPLLSPTDYGVFIFIAKVFQVPSIWWKDDLNKPGYMDRELTAASAFDMMEYYSRKYGFQAKGIPQTDLPDELRRSIRNSTGKDFTTYADYNAWVVEQNSK